MLRYVAAGSIGVYQQYVSPYKGFRCAHHALTGKDSCSQFAKRLVLRHGVIALWRAMPGQFKRCRQAYLAVLAMASGVDSAPDGAQRKGRSGSGAAWDCADCSVIGLSDIAIGACDF